ncbi:hypothetical protein SALBM311S_09334 [Streptomyces alboniger]
MKPLDPYLAKWPDWNQFMDTAKTAAKAEDGKTYGVPDGTDTRGLWFSKDIQKAGLPEGLPCTSLTTCTRVLPLPGGVGAMTIKRKGVRQT